MPKPHALIPDDSAISARDMIYKSAVEWGSARNKRVLFFGMSGVGKTHISSLLRATGDWFHYSIDYRIGTHYMGEHIVDNFKCEAMRNAFLAKLLKSDSIYIASNITFGNLAPLSTYIGKPGNPDKGGIPYAEYVRRQRLHRSAELNALRDTSHFIDRAARIYRYPHFVCDSSGSICEVVDPESDGDGLLENLSRHLLFVWIREGPHHTEKLQERYRKNPKPMYYREGFLEFHWRAYLEHNGVTETEVDPDEFSCWIYGKALDARQSRYEAIARNWGVILNAADVVGTESEAECCRLIGQAIDAHENSLGAEAGGG